MALILHSSNFIFQALRLIRKAPPMKTHIDCMTSRHLIKLPGFIDTHVHVREPGATHKEDFKSCTAAALAGGVTMICAMPNTNPAIVDEETFDLVKSLAKDSARCDYALFIGASSNNYNSVQEFSSEAAGLKMYLNKTFTTLKLDNLGVWEKHLNNWPKKAPLCVHAEGETTAAILLLANLCNRPIHICHVARKEEIVIIKAAKEKGLKVTCEVCPHHLFLSTEDVPSLGLSKSEVRPMLQTPEDQQALWDNLHVIDCFATDHAPHTVEEKTGANPPPGFPGLETILPLLLNAVNEGRLTLEDLINKFHRNPKRIFNLPDQPNTYVEVYMNEEWTIPHSMKYSKSKWTPFAGRKVKGAIHRVVLRGEVAYIDGEVLAQPGFGQNVREWDSRKPVEPYLSRPSSGLDRPLSPTINPYHYSHISANINGNSNHISHLNPTHINSNHASHTNLNNFGEKVDYDNDGHTNEIFTRLLAEPSKVHFSNDTNLYSSISPVPPRGRTESFSNVAQTGAGDGSIHHPLHGLVGKHILSVDMFNKEQLNDIFNIAQTFRVYVSKDRSLDHILRGKVMASIFYEVSTRTSCSFSAAMQRLGGRVIYMDETSSSVKKGETLEDSVAVMAGYSDVVVLRHPAPGSTLKASHHCRKPLINAGDGVGEHPTQALLDVFTIREEIGTVNGLTITLVGDLKNGRTVHSLARLLTLYNVQLRYVSPDNLKMPHHIMEYVRSKGITQEQYKFLEDALPETDVLYMTRIQRERFETQEEYDKVIDFVI